VPLLPHCGALHYATSGNVHPLPKVYCAFFPRCQEYDCLLAVLADSRIPARTVPANPLRMPMVGAMFLKVVAS